MKNKKKIKKNKRNKREKRKKKEKREKRSIPTSCRGYTSTALFISVHIYNISQFKIAFIISLQK